MDMLSQDDQPGVAMENWGLMLFETPGLLIDRNSTNADDRWDQMWLNEGFAEFVSNIASHFVEPDSHTWERFYVLETQWVMYLDQDSKHHWALTDPITTRGDIERKFGDFSYYKGASVLRMISEILTEQVFNAGLRTYLATFAYSTTTEDDLFFHLEAAALEAEVWPQAGGPQGSLGESLKRWTHQPGIPLVNARKTCEAASGCNITISQEWLTYQDQQEERKWDIKVIFDSGSSWLNADDSYKEIIFNNASKAPLVLGGVGYFRVNYDKAWWREIAEVLRTDPEKIKPMNRAQVICDVLALEEIGYVSHSIRKDILAYLSAEVDFGPLLASEQCSGIVVGAFEPRRRRQKKRKEL